MLVNRSSSPSVSRTHQTRLRMGVCVLFLVSLVATGCTDRKVDVELTAGTAHLAQTDPSLIDSLGAYLFVAYFNGVENSDFGCSALVSKPMEELGGPGLVSIQVTDAVDDNAAGRDHVFGQLEYPGPHSFLVLGSTKRHTVNGQDTGNFPVRRENIEDTFLDAKGSVVAVGCVEQQLNYEMKFDLDVVLFPAGLR